MKHIHACRFCVAISAFVIAISPQLFAQRADVPLNETGRRVMLATHVKFPVIPPEAKAKHLSGSGIILVCIRPSGSVEKAEVARSSGHKVLDDAALAAFSQWQFIPGKLSKATIPFTFTENYEKPKNHLTIR